MTETESLLARSAQFLVSTIEELQKMLLDEHKENIRLRLALYEATGDESYVEPLERD